MKWQSIILFVLSSLCFLFSNLQADMVFNDGKVHTILAGSFDENIYVDDNIDGKATTLNFSAYTSGFLQARGNSIVSLIGANIYLGVTTHDFSHITFDGFTSSPIGVFQNSTFYMLGGTIDRNLSAYDNSIVNIQGGIITGTVISRMSNQTSVTAGSIGRYFVSDNGIVTIYGSNFAFDGIPTPYGIYGNGSASGFQGLLTGSFADGSLMNSLVEIYDNGQIILTPVPPAVILGGLGLTFSGWLLHRRRIQ